MRDTILVAAPSAGGKTEVLNILREHPVIQNVPHVYVPLSDSHTLKTLIVEDDRTNGGRGHYHPWNTVEEKDHGHVHPTYDSAHSATPFTLTGNDIAHQYIKDFFTALRDLPYTGELRFAELSGGVNVNDFSEPASRTDVSFGTYTRMLRRGQFPIEGLRRVLAVIHPQTEQSVREMLNRNRRSPTDKEFEEGTASWPLGPEAMKIFGIDDFHELEPLLSEMGIPGLYTITNDGGRILQEGVEYHLPRIHELWEGQHGTRKEIR